MKQNRSFLFIVILCLAIIMSGSFFSAAAMPTVQENSVGSAGEIRKEESQEAETAATEPPSAPVPDYPSNTETTELIGFYWTPAENAEHYEVSWKRSDGTEGSAELKADDGTCAAGLCITYEQMPGDGSYTWTVSAVNEAGSAASEEASFTVRTGVPSPEAYRPATTINSQRGITFEWEDAGRSISEYRIQTAARDTGRICVDRTIPVSQIWVGNGICYLETDVYLPEGDYSWRVQGKNGTDVSGWSDWVDFQVNCPDCLLGTYLNTVTAGIYPNGRITETEPVFQWLAVTGATYYLLNVTDAEGASLLEEKVPSSNCSFTTCSYAPEITLTTGKMYRWTVSTYGGYDARWGTYEGTAEPAEPAVFTGKIAFVNPAEDGTLDPEIPLIIWTDPGTGVAVFRLEIRDEAGEALFYGDLTREEAWCDGKTCSIVFMEIPEGKGFTISVTPISESNIPGGSVSLMFNNDQNSGTGLQ